MKSDYPARNIPVKYIVGPYRSVVTKVLQTPAGCHLYLYVENDCWAW